MSISRTTKLKHTYMDTGYYNDGLGRDRENSERSRRSKIARRCLMISAIVLAAASLTVFFLRLYSTTPPKAATKTLVTQANKNEVFLPLRSETTFKNGKKISVRLAEFNDSGKLKTFVGEEIESAAALYKAFALSDYAYSESVGEIQFTLRYNNSALGYLRETYGDGILSFVLFDDANLKIIYPIVDQYTRMWNGYYRISFSGVKLSSSSDLKLVIYYGGERVAGAELYKQSIMSSE